MSTKDPTGPFPSVQQLRSGDVSYALKNGAPQAMDQSFNGFPAPTSDPLAAVATRSGYGGAAKSAVTGSDVGSVGGGKDLNAAIVEKDPARLQDQYAGPWGPKF
jgi:hypothetical protein